MDKGSNWNKQLLMLLGMRESKKTEIVHGALENSPYHFQQRNLTCILASAPAKVDLISDVRKVNSAWDHSRLGAAIEEIIRSRQSVRVRDAGNTGEIKDSGTSD